MTTAFPITVKSLRKHVRLTCKFAAAVEGVPCPLNADFQYSSKWSFLNLGRFLSVIM